MIKGKACKIVDMSTSKTGKHGHAKVHMVALDIFGKFFFFLKFSIDLSFYLLLVVSRELSMVEQVIISTPRVTVDFEGLK